MHLSQTNVISAFVNGLSPKRMHYPICLIFWFATVYNEIETITMKIESKTVWRNMTRKEEEWCEVFVIHFVREDCLYLVCHGALR